MKTSVLKLGCAAVIGGLMVGTAGAQDDEQEGRPRRGNFLRLIPVIAALDTDEDGVLSAEEIADATKALKTLDKDEDGTLSAEEMQPDFGRNRRRDRDQANDGENEGNRPRRNADRPAFTPPTVESLVERAMAFDADEDGLLSQDELKAMYEARAQRFRRGRNNDNNEDSDDEGDRSRRRPDSE
ncbi:MAG: hypothetical protein DWQ34_14315 [Planctomycetota bacterium]|nr:MAG: hypothetical protein DWQ29_24270 [Planctomycetota bacterium]REJ91616.1 MAG: hypothetical protein DWQ34_14315 [Planctomycetota bacterium]REK20015.1 MAG: hypothetical protein DWQ41_27240 [Planctomycetota bacterium]REK27582.1 MAG: hypothetical protein DWQ45_26260 [Planctomycetota bacterium]